MPTLSSISKQLGIHESTVSRCLRGSSQVSEKTRRRVMAVAEKLGYVPNQSAQALRLGQKGLRKGVIGYLGNGPEVWGEGQGLDFNRKMGTLSRSIAATGQHLLVHWYDVKKHVTFCPPSFYQAVDGVIGSLSHPQVAEVVSRHAPLVMLNSKHQSTSPAPTINMDEAAAVWTLLDRLVELGHTRIGYFRPISPNWQYPVRWQAFCEYMKNHELEINPLFTREWSISPATHAKTMKEAAQTLAPHIRNSELTAIVCPGDAYAGSLITALKLHGLECPDDYSISGFDDSGAFVSAEGPTLTSVRYPYDKMVPMALTLLGQFLDKQEPGVGEVVIKPDVRFRKSFGPVPMK